MDAPRIACIVSAAIMLATTLPASGQSPGGGRAFRDRAPQRAAVQHRHHRPVAREAFVRRPAYFERRAFVRRHAVPYAYVAPRAYYYWPRYAVRARPWYYYDYYEPPYYVIAGPALAAVEPPPPPPPPARRAPARKRFALSADALFDFDRAELKPEGRRQLSKLAADLKRAEYDIVRISMVRVTGHTDRLGSAPYNMNLSMRRAEAVKTYLVGLGIPAAKIVAAGRGEANPVTRPGQCPGEKATRELIACLQPDRRVEVEISFTK